MPSMKSKADLKFQGILAGIIQYKQNFGISYEEIIFKIQREIRKCDGYHINSQTSINDYLERGDK